MKKTLFLLLFALIATADFAQDAYITTEPVYITQENEAVTARLQQKYFRVTYNGEGDGWYKIFTDRSFKSKAGACDYYGNVIIPPKYDSIYWNKGYFRVELSRKVGFFDTQGNEIVAPNKYDEIRVGQLKDDGYAKAKLNNKWGVVDKQGKEIVAPKYDNIWVHEFKDDGYAGVKLNNKWGVVDKQGNEIVAPKYDDFIMVYEFNRYGYAPVKLSDNKWGVVDKQGKEIIPCEYTHISLNNIEDVATKQPFARLTQGGTYEVLC